MPDSVFSLEGLAEAIKAAARSLADFADSIAHVTKLSVDGYNELRARRGKKRLTELYVALTEFSIGQSISHGKVDDFLQKIAYDGLPEDDAESMALWNNLLNEIGQHLSVVRDMLGDWQLERSDFIYNEEYRILRKTLRARIEVFSHLRDTVPKSERHVTMAKDALAQWTLLIAEVVRATEALGNYLGESARD